jgi:hypothetical protein
VGWGRGFGSTQEGGGRGWRHPVPGGQYALNVCFPSQPLDGGRSRVSACGTHNRDVGRRVRVAHDASSGICNRPGLASQEELEHVAYKLQGNVLKGTRGAVELLHDQQ